MQWEAALQLSPTTADFKILRYYGTGEREWKAQTICLYPVFSLTIQCCSYLVENSQKAMLNVYFKSRFSMKPSKFVTYFSHDCRL